MRRVLALPPLSSRFGARVAFLAFFIGNLMAEESRTTPYIRSAVARNLYSKMLIDERLRRMDWRQEYLPASPLPPDLEALFTPLTPDGPTEAFIDASLRGGEAWGELFLTEICRGVLGVFLPQTTVNGLLNRGRMFLLSAEQFRLLLAQPNSQQELPEHAQQQELPEHAQQQELPEHAQQQEQPEHAQQQELPEHAQQEQPEHAQQQEQPEHAQQQELPEHAQQQELPEHAQQQEQPEHAEQQEEQRQAGQQECSREQGREQQGEQAGSREEQEEQAGEQECWNEQQEQFYDATDASLLLPENREQRRLQLLDIGAGDGGVTAALAGPATDITATEISAVMRWRLRRRGWRVLDAHAWPAGDARTYDVVTCLNVLDRHVAPRRLLRDVRGALRAAGRLVVSVVLPFAPFVEYDSATHDPQEDLGVRGESFEAQVGSLVRDVLPGLGYRVETWSKVPYLCEGDLEQSLYWLQAAVFVCSKL